MPPDNSDYQRAMYLHYLVCAAVERLGVGDICEIEARMGLFYVPGRCGTPGPLPPKSVTTQVGTCGFVGVEVDVGTVEICLG